MDTTYLHTRVERRGPITVVTLDRPEAMNAINRDFSYELSRIFDAFAADPDQWVAVLTGAGDHAFSAGNDLKATARGDPPVDFGGNGFGGLTARSDMCKPVIAAINGFAMGGGFEMALACDIIIAAENAVFALPEPHLGLAALAGGLLRLPRAIGEKRAMEIVLTGRRVSAEEGKALGFVAEVTPVGGALAAALDKARILCEASPMSIRASKETLVRGLGMPLDKAIAEQWSWPAARAMLASDDLKEGPRAFAEKRKPRWSGR